MIGNRDGLKDCRGSRMGFCKDVAFCHVLLLLYAFCMRISVEGVVGWFGEWDLSGGFSGESRTGTWVIGVLANGNEAVLTIV